MSAIAALSSPIISRMPSAQPLAIICPTCSRITDEGEAIPSSALALVRAEAAALLAAALMALDPAAMPSAMPLAIPVPIEAQL